MGRLGGMDDLPEIFRNDSGEIDINLALGRMKAQDAAFLDQLEGMIAEMLGAMPDEDLGKLFDSVAAYDLECVPMKLNQLCVAYFLQAAWNERRLKGYEDCKTDPTQ